MQQFKINKKLKLSLIGMLLGDANLQSFSNGKTARLRILHSEKQSAYIEHKYALFKPIIRTQLLNYKETKEQNHEKKVYSKLYFNTLTTNSFKFYYDMFYKDNVKVLPKLIHRYLEPITLAYWYMDDGSMKWKNRDTSCHICDRSKAVRICTDNFTKDEVNYLVDALNKKYPWMLATMQKQRSRYRIYIPNKDYQFTQLIEPYILEEMKYKLPTETPKLM